MHVLLRPHHDGSRTYVSTQTPALGESVVLRLRVPDASGSPGAHVRYVADGEPVWRTATFEHRRDGETWWRAEISCHNPVTTYRWLLEDPYRWVTQAGVVGHDPTDATDFRLVAHPPPPTWAADAIFYEIFPDRFARSASADDRSPPDWADPVRWDAPPVLVGPGAMTQFYGGDLDGIVEHLDHLVGLGVTAIWCTPFFPSRSNHRYDAASFAAVDPALGGDAALDRLLDAAHGSGIRVIGDLTTNHSGARHEWFERAQLDSESGEAGFYRFRSHPDDYEAWFDVPSLPKFDHTSERLRAALLDGPRSVVGRWLARGLDGWRIDVANMTGRLRADDHAHDVARRVRATVSSVRPDAFVVAEHAHDASGDLAGDGWYATMNYAGFTNPVWSWLSVASEQHFFGMPVPLPLRDGPAIAATIDAHAGAKSWRTRQHDFSLLDSHDSARFRSIVGDDRGRHLVGVGMQVAFPGIPMLFQGDEFAMTGEHSHLARAPLQWDGSKRWDDETLDAYRELLHLRRTQPALVHGGFRWAGIGDDHLAWLREDGDDRLLALAVRRSIAPIVLDASALGADRLAALTAWTQDVHAVGEKEADAASVGGAGVAPGGHPTRLTLPGAGPQFHLWRCESGPATFS